MVLESQERELGRGQGVVLRRFLSMCSTGWTGPQLRADYINVTQAGLPKGGTTPILKYSQSPFHSVMKDYQLTSNPFKYCLLHEQTRLLYMLSKHPAAELRQSQQHFFLKVAWQISVLFFLFRGRHT